MDKGAEFRRIHRSLLPLLGPQAVAQEVAHAALGLPVDLGGREGQLLTVEGPDPLPGDQAQIVLGPGPGIIIGRRHIQRLGALPLPPAGQVTVMVSVAAQKQP